MSKRPRSASRGFRLERIRHAVAEALELTLLPGLEDPVLRDLHVLHVEVSKGLTSIHVLLGTDRPANGLDEELRRIEPYIRAELAESLLIKRMPTVSLKVLY
jgi:ribosome-binding factor A